MTEFLRELREARQLTVGPHAGSSLSTVTELSLEAMVGTGFFDLDEDRGQECMSLQEMTNIVLSPSPVPRTKDLTGRVMLQSYLSSRMAIWARALEADTEELDVLKEKTAAFSNKNHPLVLTQRSRIDMMLALKHDGPTYPVLVFGLISSNDDELQAVKTAVAQLAILAELAWNEDSEPYVPDPVERDPAIPLSVCALALPSYGIERPAVKVTVTWELQSLQYAAESETFSATTSAELQQQVEKALQYNKPVFDYLRKRVCTDKAFLPPMMFSMVYKLPSSQLENTNARLGGNAGGTVLRQVSSRGAFVFVRASGGTPLYFFKTSTIRLVHNVASLVRQLDAVGALLVLPVKWDDGAEYVSADPIDLGGVSFFAFPALTYFRANDLILRFREVVDTLGALHRAGFAHQDVRRENIVHRDGRVKFIDLDRVMPARGARYVVARSVWYPKVKAQQLDWFQLGLSLLRECAESFKNDWVVRVVRGVGALETVDSPIVRTICHLMLKKESPPAGLWPSIATDDALETLKTETNQVFVAYFPRNIRGIHRDCETESKFV
eukprot:Rmarinus@m.1875